MINVIAVLEVNDNEALDEFKSRAMKILNSHRGKLLSAFETDPALSSTEKHTEIHYLQFPGREEFRSYRSDPALSDLANLRSRAIKSTQIFVSGNTKEYK